MKIWAICSVARTGQSIESHVCVCMSICVCTVCGQSTESQRSTERSLLIRDVHDCFRISTSSYDDLAVDWILFRTHLDNKCIEKNWVQQPDHHMMIWKSWKQLRTSLNYITVLCLSRVHGVTIYEVTALSLQYVKSQRITSQRSARLEYIKSQYIKSQHSLYSILSHNTLSRSARLEYIISHIKSRRSLYSKWSHSALIRALWLECTVQSFSRAFSRKFLQYI